jgi:hypothetical protein
LNTQKISAQQPNKGVSLMKNGDVNMIIITLWAIFFALVNVGHRINQLKDSGKEGVRTKEVVSVVEKTVLDYGTLQKKGFLVKHGQEFQFIAYNQGSRFDNLSTLPKHLVVFTDPDGTQNVIPLVPVD